MFPGLGTLVNFLLVILGSFLGFKGAKYINPRLREGVIHAIGLFTLLIGLKLVVENQPQTLKVFLILLVGGALGYLLDLDGKIEALARSERGVAEAFITSSVLFTVGPMTLLGCILEGTKGDSSLILSKATMDGFSSVILSSALGKGVMLSAFYILLFQGTITLLAYNFGEFLGKEAMSNSLFIGGGLMIVIALKLWGLLKGVKSVSLTLPMVIALFV